MGKRRHVASGRLYRGCPWLRLGPQEARAAPPPASCLELFRRGRAALRQAAAALPHTWCACRAAFRQRVPVKHAADRRLRGRKVIGLPARARHDERRAPPWPVRSRAYHLNTGVGVSSSVGAVSEQCRPVSGILDSGPPCIVSRVSRVSECRGVGRCRSVEVSECRSVESLRVAHHETHLRERSLSDW